MNEMTSRERFHAVMNFKPFDRLPILEWAGWWDKTVDRWRTEGLPPDMKDRYDICRHLGLEVYMQDWLVDNKPTCPSPAGKGLPLIWDEKDYDRVREHLWPLPAIKKEKWELFAREQKTGKAVIWFTADGYFWFPRRMFGIENHLFAFYDHPALMHRINNDLVEWTLKVLDEVCAYCTPDFMTFAEDMSYNHGPMISKELFDEFMLPYYQRITPVLRDRGIVTIIDSDGDVTEPAHWFNDAGLDGILPLERQAGVDLAVIRKTLPRMRFIGHFDKMTMPKGEAAMRAEFERLLPVASQGGFIISCDHQTPPGVSFENYKIYLRLFNEYAVKAGVNSQKLLK
jgi:uroporphyrinogen-III decarboxylase